jgi:hypothetical protein
MEAASIRGTQAICLLTSRYGRRDVLVGKYRKFISYSLETPTLVDQLSSIYLQLLRGLIAV